MDQRGGRGGGGVEFGMVRLQPWKIWALAAVGGAVALAATVVLAGLALILVPVLLLAGLAAKLLIGPTRARRPAPTAATRAGVIEGRYEVVDVRARRDTGR